MAPAFLKRWYYRNWFLFHPIRRWEYGILKNALTGGQVLDAGCGNGAITRRIARKTQHVEAVDLATDGLDVARRHNADAKITYRQADLKHLDYPDASFDTVACISVLGQLGPARQAIVNELWRLTKPRGVLFLCALTQYVDDLDLLKRPGIHVTRAYCMKSGPMRAVMEFFLGFRNWATLLSFLLYPLFWLDTKLPGTGASEVVLIYKD